MTEHKHLKKLVRERMDRTGESYSTAHRHVRAKAPLPAGLVAGYDRFGGGQHRDSTLLAHLLHQAGHDAPHTGTPYTEAMLCGLAGGIGFMYAVFEYTGLPPMMTIVAQHHPDPWVPAALGRLGISYAEEHSTAPARAEAALRTALDANRPVYCAVDRGGLPWHAGELSHAADPYWVVVAGYDDGTYHLEDRDPAPHAIGAADFVAAWSAHRKGRHHRIVVAPAPQPVDLDKAIRDALATTVAHLTGPVLGHSFDANFGFSGMGRLAAQLRDDRTKTGWMRRFADPGAYAWGVRRLHDCLELEYTAPGGTRPLYADFLDEAAGVLQQPSLTRAAAMFRESAAVWSRVADRAAEEADTLGEAAELAQYRMGLVLSRGRAAADEIRELNQRLAGASWSEAGARRAFFDEVADLVDEARTIEERAVKLL